MNTSVIDNRIGKVIFRTETLVEDLRNRHEQDIQTPKQLGGVGTMQASSERFLRR